MKQTNCLNCRSSKFKVVLDLSKEKDTYLDYLKIDYKERFYLKCQKCGLVYGNPIIDEKERKLLYKHCRDKELIKEDKYEYFQRITSLPPKESRNYQKCLFLKSYLKKRGSILDIGCGAGVFLYTFKKHYPDWEVFGIELTEEFADITKEKGVNITYGYLKKDTFDRKFDLITLIHVLEHIEDFKGILLMIRGYLKKDGLLYIEVPSAKEIGITSKSHDQFMSPHLVIFSKEVLEGILKDLGYSIIVSENFKVVKNRNLIRVLAKKTII